MNAATCRSRYAAARSLALLLLFLVSPAHLNAQRDLAQLHDSLQRIDDPSLLRGMLAERSGRQAERSPDLLTERGLIGLRLYQLTASRPDGKTAQKSFEEALRRAPKYGWAHYGLGLSLAKGPDSNPFAGGFRNSFVLDDVLGRAFGDDAPARARRAFLNAINGAPPVPQAANELADASMIRWDRKNIEKSAAALAELNRSQHASSESWLAYARVQVELGKVDEAVTSVGRAAALGADHAEGARTLALALFHSEKRDQEGWNAWTRSVDLAHASQLQLLFDDVSALVTKAEAANWSRLDLEGKRRFIRDFFEVRAALGGIPVHERVGEHYRRLGIARRHYWRSARFGVPSTNQLMMRSFSDRPYDDRGTILIRHGRPKAVIKSHGDSLGNESWVYHGLDGREKMLHFAAMQSQSDYDLIHKIPCDGDWLEARSGRDPVLGRLGLRCSTLDRASMSAEYREVAFDLLATDSDAPKFTKDLPFYFDLYTFRAPEGRTNVVAAVAVPVERLQKSDVAFNPAYRVDLSLILVDTATRKVIRQDDSVAIAATRAFKNDDLFRMHVEVAVPPSSTTLQRVIVSDPSEPGVGQLYGGPFPIPDYSVQKLMLSDIVLAEPGVEGKWRRGDAALALVPTGRFKGGSFRVFYEVYNIPQNTPYTTEVEIEPIQKSAGQRIKDLFGGKNNLSFRFDAVAMDVKNGTLQELRQVNVPFGPGRYRMRISLKTAAGEIARGERVFIIPDKD